MSEKEIERENNSCVLCPPQQAKTELSFIMGTVSHPLISPD